MRGGAAMSELKVILALDQASTSGIAMGVLGGVHLRAVVAGTARKHTDRAKVIEAATVLAGGVLADVAVMFEDHSDIPASRARNTATILGMGAARGRWEEQLDLAGHPQSMRFRVTSEEWRGAVLGRRFAKAPTEKAKAEAIRWATAFMSRIGGSGDALDHNAAEALAMAVYGAASLPLQIEASRQLAAIKRAAKRKVAV